MKTNAIEEYVSPKIEMFTVVCGGIIAVSGHGSTEDPYVYPIED